MSLNSNKRPSTNCRFKVPEPVLHVALIAAAVAVAWNFWSGSSPPQISASDVVSSWQPETHRVFLFVSPTCPFCNRSMDFYARLSQTTDSMQQAGVPVALAAVIDSSAPRWLQKETLRSSKVGTDTLLTVSSLSRIGVSEVPTVTVHTPNKTDKWVGLQDTTGEREILSAVRALGSSP